MARLSAKLSVVLLAVVMGCDGLPTPAEPANPEQAAAGAISAYDTNNNSTLETNEIAKSPALLSAMDKYDADKDGSLSKQEIQTRVQYYNDRLGSLTNFYAMVTLDGNPLAGAEVKLIPEPWLGSQAKAVTGTTDDKGMVVFRMENADEAGLYAGVYKLEVTDQGSSVPARYNTATELGQEVSPDRRELESHVTLALSTAAPVKKGK